ncbi:MAG: hypothetical protein LWX56_04180 [Ignavibacteria bacterium]|nr:hypothetical protein [Ignavibacteria bacterium]
MSRSIFSFVFVMLLVTFNELNAQEKNEVQTIISKVKNINATYKRNLRLIDTVERHYSLEGGEAVFYFNENGDIKLIESIDCAETGQYIQSYYFEKDLIYFKDSLVFYSVPFPQKGFNKNMRYHTMEYFFNDGRIISKTFRRSKSKPKGFENDHDYLDEADIRRDIQTILLDYIKYSVKKGKYIED